ncbi:MAG: hypothetical protein EXR65_01045 [Dehalococcoidia bacterium]|nr:hypothetical protein [Dehalococcoidia bacterium]
MSDASARPVVTVDLDGVICRPPLGINLGISRRRLDPHAPPRPARVPPRWLGAPFDHLRFDLRRPLPEARAALAALALSHQVVVLTGRRTSPAGWLRRHGLAGFVERLVINDGPDRSPHFKLRCIERLGAAAHVEDDARTALLLAERGAARVFLRDWPRNRNLPAADAATLTRVADLAEVARLLAPGNAATP